MAEAVCRNCCLVLSKEESLKVENLMEAHYHHLIATNKDDRMLFKDYAKAHFKTAEQKFFNTIVSFYLFFLKC